MKRKLLIDCADAPKWKGIALPVMAKMTTTSEEEWDVFMPSRGGMPTLEQVQQAELLAFNGSHHSVYEDLPWIHELCAAIPTWVATGVRILGVCFGHQLLAKALGGQVERNPSGRFVLGVETIQFDTKAMDACGLLQPLEAWQLSSRTGSTLPDTFTMNQLQSHGDCVSQLPEGAVLLARSDTAVHEMWALGNNVLALQFHPELTAELLLDKVLGPLTDNGRLSSEEAAAAQTSLTTVPPHYEQIWAVFRHYQLHGLRSSQTSAVLQASEGTQALPDARLGATAQMLQVQATIEQLITSTRAGFDAGLQKSLVLPHQLTAMNKAAASSCASAAQRMDTLADECKELQARTSGAQRALHTLPGLESLVDQLGVAVDALDVQSRALAQQLNISEVSSSGRFSRR